MDELIKTVVWPLSLAVSASAVIIFAVLVVIRVWVDKQTLYRDERKQQIEKVLLIHVQSPLRNLRTSLFGSRSELPLLAEVLPKILAVLGGTSRQRLLEDVKRLGLYDWLWQKLNDPYIDEHVDLIRLMVLWPPAPHVIARLHALLTCGYPAVRVAAAEALATTQNIAYFPAVFKEFENRDRIAPSLVADILQKFGADLAPELIRALKARGTHVSNRQAALMALIEVADLSQIQHTLLPICAHTNAEMRALAFYALGRSGACVNELLLNAAKKDSFWRVRKAAVACAVNCGPVQMPILLALLEDENWLVALSAAQALLNDDTGGRQVLNSLAKQDSVRGRRARMILAETPGDGSRTGPSSRNEGDYGVA